eukprot:6742958-Prymnesium_polylepis.2
MMHDASRARARHTSRSEAHGVELWGGMCGRTHFGHRNGRFFDFGLDEGHERVEQLVLAIDVTCAPARGARAGWIGLHTGRAAGASRTPDWFGSSLSIHAASSSAVIGSPRLRTRTHNRTIVHACHRSSLSLGRDPLHHDPPLHHALERGSRA